MDRLHALTIGDIARENARSHPARTAIVCGDDRFTFPEFDERTTRLANTFLDNGLGAGDRVLWLGQNCHRLVETVFAAAKIGAMLCAANWRWTTEELVFAIDDFDPQVVLWQEREIGDRIRAARDRAGAKARWIHADAEGDYEPTLNDSRPDDPELDVDPGSPFLVIYTAAFGGRPNGAMLSHRGFILENLVVATLQRLSANQVYLNTGPLFHVGMFMTTLATFHLGGTNVIVPRYEPEEACRLIERERCTAAYIVGPMRQRLLEANKDNRYDLSSLKASEDTPWARAGGGYGQTEVTGLVTWRGIGPPGDGSHGRTLPVAQLRVVDDAGAEAENETSGEIVVRGPTAMTGYWNRPEENARRQRDDWHHTHDLGRREADGSVTFIGPRAHMIKSGVENIYPAEVEAAIARHSAVAEVCVIGVPDPRWDQNVKAVVVLKPGQTATTEELIEHCREQLASYKKPKIVEFTEKLPRDANGFIDRDAVDAAFGGGGYPGPKRTRG
jgi:acyl-CoA synthetase (AMP-forming)/AMP-acid ligase II